ncbi:MAG: hypothetical protein UX10_C0015G0017 [Candidatus Magasanikbacteria bacterium GW2011_GWA2_45_39]|uniref:26 kDa periplasmic immunogenic protein n=1 Tax=Candidatus Magasanikbacteria bacterium GW2011_GWA2_45_39 TaxID=1619041 RepID=A0A0G1MFP6_9BACT|nr:MAG: hypothetical protein UX10_C0015G0017 [Candidatus Magasanikbacteria bacterium GW2011_GWA2_45_39]HBW74375.1 hypothetical protein [Candidatus Magasanikbacteria bacterium]
MAEKNAFKKISSSLEEDFCGDGSGAVEKKCCGGGGCGGSGGKNGCGGSQGHHPCGRLGKVIIKTLWGILLVYLIIYVGSLTRNNIKKFYYVGKMDRPQNTISISGEGKVTAEPNIASVEVGLVTDKKDVAAAQKENTGKMNILIAGIKALGIADADLQTSQYQIYPKYDYTDGKTTLNGYTVSQSVTVKIRDLSKISAVLAKTGESGANQVSGLQFTIDDPASLQDNARNKALVQAGEKAQALARTLGVNLVRVVSFNEYAPQGGPVPMYSRGLEGMGGAADATAPSIQPGSNEVKVQVNVVYEIE